MEKQRRYFYIIVTRKDGSEYPNPLQINEAYLIVKILEMEENESLTIELMVTDENNYKRIFG